jgi:hypothetical protein
MKMISIKQYEKTLDEQFDIGNITVVVARFPNGWMAIDMTNDAEICIAQPDKKTAISKVEIYANSKYDPKKTHYL